MAWRTLGKMIYGRGDEITSPDLWSTKMKKGRTWRELGGGTQVTPGPWLHAIPDKSHSLGFQVTQSCMTMVNKMFTSIFPTNAWEVTLRSENRKIRRSFCQVLLSQMLVALQDTQPGSLPHPLCQGTLLSGTPPVRYPALFWTPEGLALWVYWGGTPLATLAPAASM
jgi:hypothetical protein